MTIRMALILAAMMLGGFAYAIFSLASSEANGFKVISNPSGGAWAVIASAPVVLSGLGTYRTNAQRYAGCGFEIKWGDGTVTPQAWMGSDCAKGLRHVYGAPGVYRVQASVNLPREADGGAQQWQGEMQVNVQ